MVTVPVCWAWSSSVACHVALAPMPWSSPMYCSAPSDEAGVRKPMYQVGTCWVVWKRASLAVQPGGSTGERSGSEVSAWAWLATVA